MRCLIVILASLALGCCQAQAADRPFDRPQDPPDILLVDDTGGGPLVTFYGPACLAARRSYQEWNVSAAGTVPASTLDEFQTILWLAGHNSDARGIEGGDRALVNRMTQGGRVILIGDHIAEAAPEVLATGFGLKLKHFNPLLSQMKGRLSDVLAQGGVLNLSSPGAETAEYAASDENAQPRPEVVFWAPDRGVSRFTAARIERLGDGAADPGTRAAWFGFEPSATTDADLAREVVTRTILWTTPVPAKKRKARR